MSIKQEQLEITAQLQVLLLRDYLSLLKTGTATPADRASLARLLSSNGWSLDEKLVPQGVKTFITKDVDPSKLDDEEEARVVGRIA